MIRTATGLERESLTEAAGALLLGDHLPLQRLAAHTAAFHGQNRELLEHLALPLRESNKLEDVVAALENSGRVDLGVLLLEFARDDALRDLQAPWASIECMRRQDEGKPECVDLLIEKIPVSLAREFAKRAESLGAYTFERRRT